MKSAKFIKALVGMVATFTLSQSELRAEFPPQFLCSAVMIKMPAPNGPSGGSGFFFQTASNLFLVTARHVLFGRDPNSTNFIAPSASLASYPAPETSNEKFMLEVDLDKSRRSGNLKRHPTVDVAIIKVADFVSSEGDVYQFSFPEGITRPSDATSGTYQGFKTNDVSPFLAATTGSEIAIIGFPRSLATAPTPIQLIDAEKPLLRHGVIAGRNTQLKLLIVDAASFQGNSGGPVLQLVQIPNMFPKRSVYKLVGLVGGFIPHTEVWSDQYQTSGAMINANSGYTYVMPMDAVFELLK
jgi:hypothetical protein